MGIQLDALIKRTQSALAAETDPKAYAALAMKLSSYMSAKKDMDDEEDDDEDDDEKKSKKAKHSEEKKASKQAEEKKAEEKHSEKKASKKEEEEEEEEAKAALALAESATGMKGARALGALQALLSAAKTTAADVALLKRESVEQRRASLIEKNAGRYLTKTECTWLASQPIETVEGFVEMRQKAGVIVHTDESTIVKPKSAQPGTEESLPAEVQALINDAVKNCGAADPEAFRKALVSAHVKAHTERLNSVANGAGRF